MEEITEENIEDLVQTALNQTQNEDLLKEYMRHAARFERDDLMASILEKIIHQNRLIEKLQDYGMNSQTLVPFLSDDPAMFEDEESQR